MKQIFQSLRSGKTYLEDVPVPGISPGNILVKTSRSLVSPGTERMLVEFGRAGLISKARQQPEKLNQVIEKLRRDGIFPTLEAVFSKLDEPLPLGYCNAGIVVQVGEKVQDFRVGDLVASNGPHAEYVSVPANLAAIVPPGLSHQEAAFTPIASVGLQAIRLCKPLLGETIVVYGLGLTGMLTAQLLIANGCNVIGIDIDLDRCGLAEQWGCKTIQSKPSVDPVKTVLEYTGGKGADGVIIAASAKKDNIVSSSARMSRKRGRIILAGVVDTLINRSDFYEKELAFLEKYNELLIP